MIDPKFLDMGMSKSCETCGGTFYRDKRCTYAHWQRVRDCSRACVGKRKTAVAEQQRASKADAFFRNVDKSGDCWVWTAAKDRDGYGIFAYARKSFRAPRVALELDGREPAKGQYACHTCDNPVCVNPAHLYAGSATDNSRDMLERGRARIGSQHHSAKLTDAAVAHIRTSGDSPAKLAVLFGVSLAAVRLCQAGKTWKHVA